MLRSLLALAALTAALPAAAQIVPFYTFGEPPKQTALSASAVIIGGPRYDGSDRYRVFAAPSIDARFANGWFGSIVQGVGYNFSRDPDWDLGLRVGGLLPRKAEDEIAGLDDIPLRAVAGAFANLRVGPQLQLRSALRYGSGLSRDGLTLDLGANYHLGEWLGVFWNTEASLQWANREHLQSYFGVNAAQSVQTGLPVFEPSSGWREYRLGIGGFRPITRQWSAFGSFSAIRFGSAIDDSPIMRSKGATQLLLGLTYRF
ncbi:MipA/OmpV family protein [Rivibacter subsaxonicus]|uniref:Outer membrane scaffolding protein for murein synthesis (MipA/OmpV family) n=1 Tax=Rivibacter subsaxonicus TaxID=457575 RepID=A0A4Q7VVS7_9BURK|nr:MipA/OmpV family protein [Rivibacter subsaxonicus]RZU00750.1 outer membrane scaffolding protein for murein synthesis (MipA/OmpV family) [Rivibacter subsaxonicus]